MDERATGGMLRFFRDLPDPRAKNVVHKLHDIIVLAVCGVIAGAGGWAEVEMFASSRQSWLKTFLDLPGGIPSHDTFGRVFGALDPDAFGRCFTAWTSGVAVASGGRLVSIDGKAIRRSFEHAWDKAGMAHLVSAFVTANEDRLCFAQVAVADKRNEIDAIPKLLALLDLAGATVTIDAMGCQREVAGVVTAGGGDYVLALKENQPTLHMKVKTLLDEAVLGSFAGMSHGRFEQTNNAHGRLERRRTWVSDEVRWLGQDLLALWPGLSSVAVVESTRQDLGDLSGKVSTQRRYYISSRKGTDAKAMHQAVRGHWAVENQLHWQLDVSFGEDQRRIRKDHGAQNFSRLCRLALNLLKRDKSVKIGVNGKRLKAGWDEHYLLRLLTT